MPEWTPEVHAPVSHTMDTRVRLDLAVRAEGEGTALEIRGAGPEGLTFARARVSPGAPVATPARSLAQMLVATEFSHREGASRDRVGAAESADAA